MIPLSWAAKYGLGLETSGILGHRRLGTQRSANTYSRDAQAVLQLEVVINANAEGSFKPDVTRSGRFVKVIRDLRRRSRWPFQQPLATRG